MIEVQLKNKGAKAPFFMSKYIILKLFYVKIKFFQKKAQILYKYHNIKFLLFNYPLFR
jgi:hypothetical protein